MEHALLLLGKVDFGNKNAENYLIDFLDRCVKMNWELQALYAGSALSKITGKSALNPLQ